MCERSSNCADNESNVDLSVLSESLSSVKFGVLIIV